MPQRFLLRRLTLASPRLRQHLVAQSTDLWQYNVRMSRNALFTTSTYHNDNVSKGTSPGSEKDSEADSRNANEQFFTEEVEQPEYDASDHLSMPKNFGTNQYMEINEELRERLRQVLWQFKAPIRYAVAYGSGVFSQGKAVSSSSSDKPMIDLLFGVTFTQHWHSLNLAEHRKHYSSLGTLGSGIVSFVQDRIGAGVYFNPYVEMNGMVKLLGIFYVARK